MYYVLGKPIVAELAASLWEQGLSFRVLAIAGTSNVVAIDELRCQNGHILVAESQRTAAGGIELTGRMVCECGEVENVAKIQEPETEGAETVCAH